jgi:hypothetical protein
MILFDLFKNKVILINRIKMTTDWLLRVGDGDNFKHSSRFKIWGIQSLTPNNKSFLKQVKHGDKLWFVLNKSRGKLLAVATYISHNKRELGPHISLSMTNEELGWCGCGPDWTSDIEIHYTDLYGLENCDLLTHIKCQTTIRKYDEKCMVNLPVEYGYIVRYSKITSEL